MQQIPKIEEKILKFWKKNNIFEKSVKQRQGRPHFSFYDGPPFATGLPHYGHILSSVSKDLVPRYFTMRGFKVERRWGWDCHGLPIENIVEAQLGIKNKVEIEKDIGKFNQACSQAVSKYVKDWEKMVHRIGRFVDFDNSYKTMDNEYMESVWWAFKDLWKRNLVYEGYRTSLYCPRCATPLSNFEIAMDNSYKDEEDDSVYVFFKNKNTKNEYFLVWTTTPWTLLANVVLAVDPKLTYVKVKFEGKVLILAEAKLSLLGKGSKVIKKIKGRDLEGLKYEPIFPQPELKKDGYKVVSADFVSAEDGSGIVHIAPAFGAEDYELGQEKGLPMFSNVDEEGKFIDGQWNGQGVWESNDQVIDYLKNKGHLFKKEKVVHSYPFCWRCETKLIYKVQKNWFIKVTAFKDNLLKANQKIGWHPNHLKKGRFGKGLETAPDWNVSRNRYWGNPIPIWKCKKCDQVDVIGSYAELKKKSGKVLKNYHRPHIDKVTYKCKCGGKMVRIEDVFDCWVESGSMPFAELHYPFENKKKFEERFPADFISEYIAQTRGWFYTLHVLAVGLFNKPSFLNAVTTGTIMAEDGGKLSKSKRNFPDPWKLLEKYPMDALRLYLMVSPLMLAENLNFSEKGVSEVYRRDILTLWNSFGFFNIYRPKNFKPKKRLGSSNKLDMWVLSRINSFNQKIVDLMDNYEITKSARLIDHFIEDLSNWYIRRSRRRFQKPENKKEHDQAAQVLYYLLLRLSKIAAPFIPFITESIYLQLKDSKDKQSIHLCNYPEVNKKFINPSLESKMDKVREIITLALAKRAEARIKIRQPLSKLTINNKQIVNDKELVELIKDEVNIKQVDFGRTLELDIKITEQLRTEGTIRELIRFVQGMRKDGGLKPGQSINLFYSTNSKLEGILKKYKKEVEQEVTAKKMEAGSKKQGLLIDKEVKLDKQKIWLGIKK